MQDNTLTYKKKIFYNPFFVFLINLLTPIILFFLRVNLIEVKGELPKKGPFLIAAHHEEIADQYLISKKAKRRLFWVADITGPASNNSLADTHFMKWVMLRLGAIPIDKHNPDRNKNLFDYLLYLLEKGEAIVFFPEAYIRQERKGRKFGEFKDGIIRLALEYETRFDKPITIVPIGINYLKKKSLKKATIKIGDPIIINKTEDKEKIFNKIKELSR